MQSIIKALTPLLVAVFVLLFSRPSSIVAANQRNANTIELYSRQAEQALAAKNAAAAEPPLEALARLTPNDPGVNANLGTVYYMQGRYEQAVKRFRKALELDPRISGVRPLLGVCYADLGMWQEAVPLLAAAFQHPPNVGVGRLIGIELMGAYSSLGENFLALEVSEKLLQRYPNDAEILYRAGHLYGDRALEIMNQLVRVAPKSPWEHMAFAEALEDEKRYSLAIIEYRKVIAADPQMPGVHYGLGRALMMNSTDSRIAQDGAIKQFQLALEADPRDAGSDYELGEIYRRRGQVNEAEIYFARAVTISPGRAAAQIALARALIALQEPASALPHLRLAVKLSPQSATAHFLLAEVYKSQGSSADYQRELALYRKYSVQPFAGNNVGGP